jgi:hypothetical protein
MTGLSRTVGTAAESLRNTKLPKFLDHNPDHKLERSRLDVGAPPGSLSRSEPCRRTAWHRVDCLLLVSSESDSAALAPLQQDFCLMTDRLVQSPSIIATQKSVQESLRERPPGVWQVRVSLGTLRYRYAHATVQGGRRDDQKAAARLVSEAAKGGSL